MVRLCYSIYKVQFCSFWILLSAANFYILAQSVSFVKNFFRSFSNFFLSRCPPGKPFIGQLEYVITDVFVCQDFSSSFFKLFLFSVLPAGRSSDSRHILSLIDRFVKHLFYFFRSFLYFFFPSPFDHIAADFRQRIRRIRNASLMLTQISNRDHSAQYPVLYHRQPPHLPSRH